VNRALAVATLMGLAAWQPTKAPADERKGAGSLSDACGAAGQDKSVLAARTFEATTRVIEPGRAITMDYSDTRLNIAIGADGRIARVFCG
jgi:hypothetical protein